MQLESRDKQILLDLYASDSPEINFRIIDKNEIFFKLA
jgi:hypothetical protein